VRQDGGSIASNLEYSQVHKPEKLREEHHGLIFIGFRAWVHRPDGTIVTAKELGVRGIPIWVKPKRQ
jgi:hypothetical protein